MGQLKRAGIVSFVGWGWILLGIVICTFAISIYFVEFSMSPESRNYPYFNRPVLVSRISPHMGPLCFGAGLIGIVCGFYFLRRKLWAKNVLEILGWLILAGVGGLFAYKKYMISDWSFRYNIIESLLDDPTKVTAVLGYGLAAAVLLLFLRRGTVKKEMQGVGLVEILRRVLPSKKWCVVIAGLCLVVWGRNCVRDYINYRIVLARPHGFINYFGEGGYRWYKGEVMAGVVLRRYEPKLKALSERYPNDAEIHIGLGLLREAQSEWRASPESESEYRQALRIDPNNQAMLAENTMKFCRDYFGKRDGLLQTLQKAINYAESKGESKIVLRRASDHSWPSEEIYDDVNDLNDVNEADYIYGDEANCSYDPNEPDEYEIEWLYKFFKDDANQVGIVLKNLKEAKEKNIEVSNLDFLMLTLLKSEDLHPEDDYSEPAEEDVIEITDFNTAMGQLTSMLNKYDQLVEERIESAKQVSEGNAFYDYLKAGLYFNMDKNDEAIEILKTAVSEKYFKRDNDVFINAVNRVYREVGFPRSKIQYITGDTCGYYRYDSFFITWSLKYSANYIRRKRDTQVRVISRRQRICLA